MKTQTHIIVIPIEYGDRSDLENICLETFYKADDVRSTICENNVSLNPEHIMVFEVSDFCDVVNNQDFCEAENWIGCVKIEVK